MLRVTNVLFLLLILATASCSSSTRSGNEALSEKGGHVTARAEDHEATLRLQQEIIRQQEEELKRQEREIEDLKRQQHYNRVPKPYGK